MAVGGQLPSLPRWKADRGTAVPPTGTLKETMAMELRFTCPTCGDTRAAWDDGNPFYIDGTGKKQFAYHPDKNLDRCIGNDSPHLCLACGTEFNVDSREPTSTCPSCGSADISDLFKLTGKLCPKCKTGRYRSQPGAIS
jgi:Zn finger protein HypA/HybF involved in hydrogenase expression